MSRRSFLLQSLSYGLIASGCSTRKSRESREQASSIPRRSIAVLGVVQQAGLKIPVNEYRLATDFETILREEQGYAVMPYRQVRIALGEDRQDLFLRRLASIGELDDSDLTMLEQAELPTRMGVALSLTGDQVTRHNEQPTKIRNNQGQLLSDRQHVVLSTMRSVTMTATVVELAAGKILMHDSFNYQSIERKRYLNYTGSSFSGSVAAKLANTVSNGVRTPGHPEAPGVYGSFHELLSDVAVKLPIA